MSWIGTSPSPLRSARSRTALIAYSAFAEIRMVRAPSRAPLASGGGGPHPPTDSPLPAGRRPATARGAHLSHPPRPSIPPPPPASTTVTASHTATQIIIHGSYQ